MKSSQPLIELAEGRSQDKRSDLMAAFRRVVNQSNRRQVTDLHVRELLTYVNAADYDGNGVQKSIAELANDVLVVPEPTCRNIIKRAVQHFGLLEVIEDRNVRGGQSANRYRVKWSQVRFLNSSIIESRAVDTRYHPGDSIDHPPDLRYQPPDTTDQPTDPKLTLTSSLRETTTTRNVRTTQCAAGNDPWSVVVVSLEGILAKAAEAVQGAKRLGFTPERCLELINHWRSSELKNNPGALYRWLTMARSAPKSFDVAFSNARLRSKGLSNDLKQIALLKRRREELVEQNGGKPLTDEQIAELDQFALSIGNAITT